MIEHLSIIDDFLSETQYGYEQFGYRSIYYFIVAAALQPSPQILLIGGALSFFPSSLWAEFYDYVELWTDKGVAISFGVVIPICFAVIYWTHGLIMLYLDIKYPDFMDKFRCQVDRQGRGGNKHWRDEAYAPENLRKLFINIMYKTLIIPPMIFSYCWPLMKWNDGYFALTIDRSMPHFRDAIVHTLFASLVQRGAILLRALAHACQQIPLQKCPQGAS